MYPGSVTLFQPRFTLPYRSTKSGSDVNEICPTSWRGDSVPTSFGWASSHVLLLNSRLFLDLVYLKRHPRSESGRMTDGRTEMSFSDVKLTLISFGLQHQACETYRLNARCRGCTQRSITDIRLQLDCRIMRWDAWSSRLFYRGHLGPDGFDNKRVEALFSS